MADTRSMAERIEELRKRKAHNEAGGGEKRLEKQRASGKKTARDRIADLVDGESFEEIGLFAENRTTLFGMAEADMPADGVVTGTGSVLGRPVHIASQDFTVAGGSAGEMHSTKVANTLAAALTAGTPFIFINDSGGARVQEGIDSLSGYGKVFYQNVQLSGAVPQISIIAGPCAGGAAYSPALTDFIIQTRKAQMFITGPNVIKSVTGEDVTGEQLGGPDAHMQRSGNIHFIADDDEQAVLIAKKLLSFLPNNNLEEPERLEGFDDVAYDNEIADIVPTDAKKAYDVRDVIARIVDKGDFLEIQSGFAPTIVIGFARITGRTVGIVANQAKVMSGVLDINSSDKAAYFVQFCDAFNIPIVTLVDVPGFMPGTEQEYGGIIRHGAKMLYAYSEATVPLVTVVLRKAYGGAYLAMAAKDLGADRVLAWPTAEIAVMGAEGAANVVFRREIEAADDPESKRAEMVDAYQQAFNTPYVAGARGLVDRVIEPGETRAAIANALEVLANKSKATPAKKHGVLPF